MILKNFQSIVLEQLNEYLNILKKEYTEENILVEHYKQKGEKRNFKNFCKTAWEKLEEGEKLPSFKDKKGHFQKQPLYFKKRWIRKCHS